MTQSNKTIPKKEKDLALNFNTTQGVKPTNYLTQQANDIKMKTSNLTNIGHISKNAEEGHDGRYKKTIQKGHEGAF